MATQSEPPTRSKPYDPDQWARRYGIVGVTLLVVSMLLGLKSPWGDQYSGAPLAWVVGPSDHKGWWTYAIPVFATTLAIVGCVSWRGRSRALAIFAAGSLCVVGPFLVTTIHRLSRLSDGSYASLREFLYYSESYRVAMLAAGIAIFAGGHVRRTFARSVGARLCEGLGGLALPIAFAMIHVSPMDHMQNRLHSGPFRMWDDCGAERYIENGLATLVTLLGIAGLRAETTTLRVRWLGALSIVVPVVWYLAPLIVPWLGAFVDGSVDRRFGEQFEGTLKSGTHHVGGWVLCTVGLAALLEARIVARARQASSATLDRVFG